MAAPSGSRSAEPEPAEPVQNHARLRRQQIIGILLVAAAILAFALFRANWHDLFPAGLVALVGLKKSTPMASKKKSGSDSTQPPITPERLKAQESIRELRGTVVWEGNLEESRQGRFPLEGIELRRMPPPRRKRF